MALLLWLLDRLFFLPRFRAISQPTNYPPDQRNTRDQEACHSHEQPENGLSLNKMKSFFREWCRRKPRTIYEGQRSPEANWDRD